MYIIMCYDMNDAMLIMKIDEKSRFLLRLIIINKYLGVYFFQLAFVPFYKYVTLWLTFYMLILL